MTHTPGPYEMSKHCDTERPTKWRYVKHNFPHEPYEGDLEDEFGIYPPLGEAGPVALVAGEDNAKLFVAAPAMLKACEAALSWLCNVNMSDPTTVARQLMAAMQEAGYDKTTLDDAATAIVRGPCSCPNVIGCDGDCDGAGAVAMLREIVSDASPCTSACSRLVDVALIEKASDLLGIE